MKKIIEVLFERFWINFGLMLGISILDLIGLGGDGKGIGLGFIVSFLYFLGWIIYNMTKKSEQRRSF